ncbi:two-component system sensor histidine kinase NtrB [Caldalkalibacillus mannanilyticus]|uniref:two-component system sensor histidine kinase NtrB n=1 Tax=Caldalkalibacillus mannanilyticus TaxID=1418 RepID=UPI000468970F|nr:HAMP domain-containing sensor histidine kinase [Caldalkalibacillus mannanilyticus]
MKRLFFNKWFQKQNEKWLVQEKEEQPEENKNPSELEKNQSLDNYHAVIGKMSAFFAHEIRNPLTSIIGFAQFLDQHPTIKSDPNVSHYISIIKEEAVRMEALIQELLSLSKSHLDHDNLSIIDVKHSIEKVVTLYTMQQSKQDVQFKLNLVDEIYVTGNTNRFERVLINLINNAIDAMEKKGVIDIRVVKESKFVVISIIDSGPGISAEKLEHIFYPFFTTKDEGTGLGLPICKTIIETINGTLDIQNHPTKGVHVKIRVPLSQHTSYKG